VRFHCQLAAFIYPRTKHSSTQHQQSHHVSVCLCAFPTLRLSHCSATYLPECLWGAFGLGPQKRAEKGPEADHLPLTLDDYGDEKGMGVWLKPELACLAFCWAHLHDEKLGLCHSSLFLFFRKLPRFAHIFGRGRDSERSRNTPNQKEERSTHKSLEGWRH
jgi:hypothetical protein